MSVEDVIVDIGKSLGLFGTIGFVILYIADKLPSVLSNFDSYSNRKLKNLSDMSQGNYLEPESAKFVSNFLSESLVSKVFNRKISSYEIIKINSLHHLLDGKVSIDNIVGALDSLNLKHVNFTLDDIENLLDYDAKEVERQILKNNHLTMNLLSLYFITNSIITLTYAKTDFLKNINSTYLIYTVTGIFFFIQIHSLWKLTRLRKKVKSGGLAIKIQKILLYKLRDISTSQQQTSEQNVINT